MSLTPAQQRGLDWEVEAAEALGLAQTAGSGNQARDRSDAKGALRLSCKSSSDRVSWAEVKRHVAEAVDMSAGTGETPALALEDHDGDQFLIIRMQDAAEWVSSQQQTVVRRERRSDRVRGSAFVPLALRED